MAKKLPTYSMYDASDAQNHPSFFRRHWAMVYKDRIASEGSGMV
jgi:hypothetical protein